MMAEPHSMIRAFSALPNTSARYSVLESLVTTQLTPYEWRFLQSLLNTRQFQFDIIGQLPIELVAHVFSFLDTDPAIPFRLQIVSRRWNQVFRNLDILKSALKSWCSGTADLHGVDYAVAVQRARSIHAFRTGRRPNISFKISGRYPCRHTLLVGDTLIWLPGRAPTPARSVNILNLHTGHLWEAQGQGREQILTAEASDDLLAFSTSSNLCYVSTLDGHERKKFRVANRSMFDALTCRGRYVACAGIIGNHAAVYIWNFDSQQGTAFDIPFTSPPFVDCRQSQPRLVKDIALLLHPETETIVVFSGDRCTCIVPGFGCRCHETRPSLHYGRFTFRGKYSHGSSAELSCFEGVNLKGARFAPVNRDGLFTVQFNVQLVHIEEQKITDRISVHYDERVDQFFPLPDFNKRNLSSRRSPWNRGFGRMACYKDIVVWVDGGVDVDYPWPLMHTSASGLPNSPPLEMMQIRNPPFISEVFTNGRYVVVQKMEGYHGNVQFYVLCYDENITGIPSSRPTHYDIERFEWGTLVG